MENGNPTPDQENTQQPDTNPKEILKAPGTKVNQS